MDSKSDAQYKKMTETPIYKLIIILSIPTIISMMVTNIYNLVDTAFVGTLGNSASGAIGVVFGFMSVLQAVGFLFGQGSGSIIARKLGNKDVEASSRAASTGFFWAFFLAIIVAVLCAVFSDPLIMFLGSTETIAPYAKTYISYILLSAPFMVTGFTMNNILRYEGKAVLGMIGLMTGAILNICGDAFFIIVLDMGISGAGLSTAISQMISFIILLSAFLTGKTQSRISIIKISFKIKNIGDIAATGLPSLLRQGLNSITTILLNMEAAPFGDAAIAAMSIVSRIFFFIFSVALGVGQGFQPVSGFNYGAKKYARVREAFKFTWFFSEALMLIIGTLVFMNAEFMVSLLRNDAYVIEIGTRALKLQCAAVVFLPFCMVTEMLFQSTGQKFSAAIVSALRSGIVFIPVLILMANLRGISGIQEAQPLAYVISVIPTVFFAVRFFKKLPKENENA